jgi:hypothetical protein
VAGSLRDGHEHAADFPGFRLDIIVRSEDGHETYVAIRIGGSVPKGITALILTRVPGCEPDAWFRGLAKYRQHRRDRARRPAQPTCQLTYPNADGQFHEQSGSHFQPGPATQCIRALNVPGDRLHIGIDHDAV